MKTAANEGIILQLQKFSVEDGDGVRTVIFLPGCPLRCKWCSNPETWDLSPKLAVYDEKCVGCGACAKACPKALFPPKMNGCENARDNCNACGLCADTCPNGALAVLCENVSVDDVVRQIERDAVFFSHSGGGVTFSGGEPTVQEGLLRALTERFYSLGISIWVETCGYFDFESVKDIFEKTDHVLFDIKCINSALHKELTGKDNSVILENCVKLRETGVPITVRLPAVKNVNFTDKNLKATAEFMRDNLPGADIELLPYHNFGKEKYQALRMTEHLYEFESPSQRDIAAAYSLFQNYGIETVSTSQTLNCLR